MNNPTVTMASQQYPHVIDGIMQHVIGFSGIGIKTSAVGIPSYSAGFFGVFVSVKSPRKQNVYGCMGHIEASAIDLPALALHAERAAHNALYVDGRSHAEDGIPDAITDPQMLVEVDFMQLPLRTLDDNGPFDPDTDGLLLISNGAFTTFLPGVFTRNEPLDSIKQRLLKKAGKQDGKFVKYTVMQITTSVLEWIPRARHYFKQHMCDNVPYSHVTDHTDVRETSVREFCDMRSRPDSAQAMAMVANPTADMITNMSHRLETLVAHPDESARQFEIPELALALARAGKYPDTVNFDGQIMSIFQWNWDCQLLHELKKTDIACKYAQWALDPPNQPDIHGPWNMLAVWFEGLKACISLVQTSAKCREYVMALQRDYLLVFCHLSRRYVGEPILRSRPDLAEHFINGL